MRASSAPDANSSSSAATVSGEGSCSALLRSKVGAYASAALRSRAVASTSRRSSVVRFCEDHQNAHAATNVRGTSRPQGPAFSGRA